MEKKTKINAIIAAGVILFVLFVDQLIKYVVKTQMMLYEKIEVTRWFQIFFTENDGMAFGMDLVATSFLAIFRVVVIVAFAAVLVNLVRKGYPRGLIICFSMIISGAVGNIIDNALYGLIYTESLPVGLPFATPAHLVSLGEGYGSFLSGRVVDMFYFPLFVWPEEIPFLGGKVFFNAVFNFADASISCGAVILLLFYHKYLSGVSFYKTPKTPTTTEE